jgi:hypothetical protein
MPKKSRKKTKTKSNTRKQKVYNMIGCSKKHNHNKNCKKDLGTGCPNCGPNCHCGPQCNCPHPCPGSCYLNRRVKQKGGQGCGSCGCPVGGLTYGAMNKFGGSTLDGAPVLSNNNSYGPILGISQNGGNCPACSQIPVQSGGNFYKPAAAIPGPMVGSAWGASVKDWPTMNGVGADKNYLDNSSKVIVNDPQQQMSMANSGYKTLSSMIGGYTYKNKKTGRSRSRSKIRSSSIKSSNSSISSQKGGATFIPQDLLNLGRNFAHNFQSAYNTINGYKQPVTPLPHQDQLTRNVSGTKLLI